MLRLSKPVTLAFASPLLLLSLAYARPAHADALPMTACDQSASAGQSCTTAGDGTEDGVCVESTCGSLLHLDDGGFMQGSYPCLLCEIPDAGPPSSDSGTQTTDAGPAPDDAGPTKPPSDDAGPPLSATDAGTSVSADAGTPNGATSNQLASNSSCAVATVGAHAGGAGALFGLGAVGLAFSIARSRRRRSL